jgi:hypothetical protein
LDLRVALGVQADHPSSVTLPKVTGLRIMHLPTGGQLTLIKDLVMTWQ